MADDQHHSWARETWALLESPGWTCEPVLSEAQFIIRRLGGDPLAVLKTVQKGVLRVALAVEGEVERLLELQRSHADVPMSLADACLVRMTELHDNDPPSMPPGIVECRDPTPMPPLRPQCPLSKPAARSFSTR